MYWWESHPERFEFELEALGELGIRYQIDETAKRRGQLRIRAWPHVGNDTIEVDAVFPDLFPEFRFEVTSEGLSLNRHQHRLSKNLCLIGRSTENWDPRYTLAEFLVERLPNVVAAASDGAGSALEERQAEPESDYFLYEPEASLIIDGSWAIPTHASKGSMDVAVLHDPRRGPLRGVVITIRDDSGLVLAEADPALTSRVDGLAKLVGRWVRLDRLPDAYGDPYAFREHLASEKNLQPERAFIRTGSDAAELVGVLFSEDHEWPASKGDGWVFIVSWKPPQGKKTQGRAQRYFCRAERGGPQDVKSRVPGAGTLAEMGVAIFGLGAVGGPVAEQLINSGIGTLHMNDPDRVDPATSSRTPYGILQAGMAKVNALGSSLTHKIPYTEIKAWRHRVGAVRSPDAPHETEILHQILDGMDVVVDATAEIGVQMALSRICSEREIPYVLISATPGGWGGTVAHFLPDSDAGCALCWAWERRSNQDLSPPADPAGEFQPTGCADPTFTGAGSDLMEMSMEAVRTVVDILQGVPPRSNIAVCSLRDPATGERMVPTWKEVLMPRNSHCGRCAGREEVA